MDILKSSFNKLVNINLDKKSKIEKISNNRLIMSIDNIELKLEYYQILCIKDDLILWSYNNPYIDQRTRMVSKKIELLIGNYNKNKIENILKNINVINIKLEGEEINILGFISEIKNGYKFYYLISEILIL